MVRGLVLGGGGVTGIAWELGIIAGLRTAGVDLAAADVIIGTSAGSVVGAQLASGAAVEGLYGRQLRSATGEIAADFGASILLRYVLASARPGGDRRARARLGRAALRARTVSEAERRAVIAGRLAGMTWPVRQRLLITAVEAETGEPKVFDRDSDVDLVDAVAASCAVPLVWPPVTVAGRRYVDGGVRSPANVDLAAGCTRVVVLAPVAQALRRAQRIAAQVAALGPKVRTVVVSPDRATRSAMGRNVLDPAFRAASARAGREQAATVAAAVSAVWR